MPSGHSVFKITNNYNNKCVTVSSSGTDLLTATANANDRKQWWYVVRGDESSLFYFRNVSSGAYMACTSDGKWFTASATEPTPSSMLFEVRHTADIPGATGFGENCYSFHLASDKNNRYAHNNNSTDVISWTWNAGGSQWLFDKIDLTDEQLAEIIERMDKVGDDLSKIGNYQACLNNLFEDAACTILKDIPNIEDTEDYKALSPTLRTMVDKVKAQKWDETCGQYDWDSEHAFKYRVQMYEPYSEGNAAAGLAAVQAYTNMNNPTGILSKTDDVLYIMVESDIPAGATLYINGAPDEGMYNSTTSGTKLHKGLNAILGHDDHTHYYIYYTVNTVENGKITSYKVTDFAPIKIHIEGGSLNGFFNYVGDSLYEPDQWKDFLYTSERATHIMYDLVGKYVILHFHLEDMPQHPGEQRTFFGVKHSLDQSLNPDKHKYNPVEIMTDWDNMCFTQRILMGIQSKDDISREFNRGMYSDIVGEGYAVGEYKADPGFHFSDYFNNRMMGISQQGDLYMNATSWRTAYNVNTISYVLTQFFDDGLWGPAHEYGHMNQGPINMAGTTEVSNNTFSNVATYFSAEYNGSRNDMPKAQLDAFLDGKCFIQYGGGNTTRMFWQLWCYYHGTRHNTKFYPRLFELLRKNPLRKVTVAGGNHNERYDMLHFAKMCCIAAGEDLTNFFTAWGFFVPLENFLIDDYSQYNAFLTKEDIAAVKQEIKDLGFEQNNAILFIDDRVGKKTEAGDFGSLADYENGGSAPSGNFGFTVNGTTVTVSNDNGTKAGYMIFDDEGNLLGFSNSSEFDVTPELANALLSGAATVKAVGSDNSEKEVTNTILDGDVSEKLDILKDILEKVENLLDFTDDSYSHVGYFVSEKCERLRELRQTALELLDSEDGDAMTQSIKDLSDEYLSLMSDEDCRVKIVEGATYCFTNRLYPKKILTANATNCISTEYDGAKSNAFARQWIFEKLDEDKYAIKNLDNGLYVGTIGSNDTPLPLSKTPVSYTMVSFSDLTGMFAFAPNNETSHAIHMASNGNIVRWYTTSNASNWTLTKINGPEYVTLHDELIDLIQKSENILGQAGDVQYAEPYEVELTNDCFYSNAPYTGYDTADRFKSWDVITDGSVNTYFCSDWSGTNSTDGLFHYIRITAPGEDTFRHIVLTYTTRNSSQPSAQIQAFNIDASSDKEVWTTAYTVSGGLKTGPAQTNATPEISLPEGTRHIRFMVTRTPHNLATGHYCFAISQLSLTNRTDEINCTPSSQFAEVTADDMKSVAATLRDVKSAHASMATSASNLNAQYDRLNADYTNLYDKMFGTADIFESEYQDDSLPEYFNLQGIRIDSPSNGIYIKRQGNSAEKVLIK